MDYKNLLFRFFFNKKCFHFNKNYKIFDIYLSNNV